MMKTTLRPLPRVIGSLLLTCSLLSAAPLAMANQTLRFQVASGTDDAEEGDDGVGVIDLTSSDLELTEDHSGRPQLVGVRFRGVDIPRGTQVLSAYLQFAVDEPNKNRDPFGVSIYGEAADDAAAYATTMNNISNRTRTSASAVWSTSTWGAEHEAGAAQRTTDISAVVQEIVNRDGWQAGNAMSFVIEGYGTRTAESYEGSIGDTEVADLAPQLVVVVPSTETYQVSASDDDAEEGDDGPGSMDISSSDLELTEDHRGTPQTVGIRLRDVGIPKGAQILSAHLQFSVDEGDKNADPFDVQIWGEAADSADTYRNTAYNISTRDKTAGSVSWMGIPAWSIAEEGQPGGANQRTPDLAALIQEIVDRDGWEEGNAMAFILQGVGQRTAESFDGSSAFAPALVVSFIGEQTAPSSERVRLTWGAGDDPATDMNVIWDQTRGGGGAQVLYDLYDANQGCEDDRSSFRFSKAPNRVTPYRGMNNYFTKLNGLAPDTAYRFVIADDDSKGECMWFRTAPDVPKAFTYISGGDTKSSGNALEAGRWSNEMVAKLRPLFVVFTGDFNSGDGTNDARWQQWLSDWSTGTRSADGRMYPVVAVHGNHEDGDFEVLYNLFDSGNNDPAESANHSYFSLTFGGDLLHLINLNSQLWLNGKVAAHNRQLAWLEYDLAEHAADTFKVAGYHKPIRPHTSSKSENDHELDWAELFDRYNLTIANESDTHNHAITFPLRRSEAPGNDMGFVRNDDIGVMYVGEGSWGASPRVADDDKSWTLDSAAINQIKWNHVFPATESQPARLDIRTVVTARYENGRLVNYVEGVGEVSDTAPFQEPAGITLHRAPFYGEVISLPFEAIEGDAPLAPASLTGEALSYTDIRINWANVDQPENVGNLIIERKVGLAGTWEIITSSLSPEATSFEQSNLNDGTDYYYRVAASNVFGSSGWSNEVLVKTPRDTRAHFELSEGSDGYAGTEMVAIAERSPDQQFSRQELSFDQSTNDFGSPDGIALGLIRFDGLFDSGLLPEGAVVNSATLRFWTTSSSNGPVALHQMLQPWDSGSSWNSFVNGVQPDGYEAAAEADDQESNVSSGNYLTLDVTKSVAAWANGEPNNGWLILNRSTDGWDTATDLYSGDSAAERRPRLTVYYTLMGDVDGNGVLEAQDLQEIRGYIRQPASACPACDLDGDGTITMGDARQLALLIRR